MASIRIGISGWRYPPWRGVFYPQGLAQKRELEFAAQHFPSVEINGSFYSLQRPEFYASWYEQTPPGFVFAVKGGRFITHMKKLRDVEQAAANFFASGVLALREKLGPILWQFPESMPPALDRFEAFLQLLPRDTDAAARLARGHGPQLRGRALTESFGARKIRHAFELRNAASASPELIALLRAHGVAWVVADTAGRWPYFEDVTADFVYVRLHGDETLYSSGYADRALTRWAERIACWRDGGEPSDAQRIAGPARTRASGRDVYVYFDNDVKVYAPFDALTLQRELGLEAWQPDAEHAARRRPGRRVREEPLRSASAWPGAAALRRGSAAGAPTRSRTRGRTGS